ncbi:MAG: PspC domain-containing protein [Rhodothermales bacterium]
MPRERSKTYPREESPFSLNAERNVDLESLSDDELEALLFEEESAPTKGSPFNLPTIAGLSLIVIGMVYIFQYLGMWNGMDVAQLAQILPWLAGILIILVGLGVLSWRPRKKARVRRRRTVRDEPVSRERVEQAEMRVESKKRLTKSADKKIAGVCAGIADYFNIDPTLVRIAFVVGTIVTNGAFLAAYIVLSLVMPKQQPLSEERITIIRD